MAQRVYDNRLGIKGWAVGARWGIERYLYTLHRITGIGIVLYFLAHIIVTTMRVYGKASWEGAMASVSNPVFHIGEWLVFLAFCFHAMNGIRLVLIELGFMVGKPIEPIYPYPTCIGKQRPVTIILMILAIVWIVAGSYDFFLVK
ncbi:MAG TPA: succinate dehydrogenase, cytochrome b556 subunit [Thermoanaerobaculia bacterium]|nr:succinate dehydrogenase, cytochrome b556 subunit [Thermoanaerobaculia bacterium]HUM29641.1 succinate dehydrogenase, cytochrome b556 subunit [Thermoanaerobaculia bacterium]HXK67292.1 succinate dehydrogenase, cytochrome b556 subunit [Thermoanaerobaculia bacterium]